MNLAPIALSGQLLNFNTSDDVPTSWGANGASSQFTIGSRLMAAPTDGLSTTASVPNWGLCELVYALNRTGSVIEPGRIVHLDKDFGILDKPTTAGTGRPIFVALTKFAIGSTTAQGGWLLRSGIAPVQFSVAATVGNIYGGTAGKATPTAAAGRQLLNAHTLIAAAGSFTAQVTTRSGSTRVAVSGTKGMYIGQAVSGTGVAASSTIASIDQGGRSIVLNNAATATGTVTGTFTHTNFGIVHLDNAFVQGQIT